MKHNRTTTPGWWLIAKRELSDLWLGGRALILLILFSILLGLTSFLLASNSELRLLPPQEMIFMIVQITITVGLFIGVLLAADTISGERERATLEGLLLVPTSRAQIVAGKFVAAASPWPAALLIAIIHLFILSPNATVFGQGLLWATLLGTLLVLSFTGFGMLVSLWAKSNRTSLFVGLFVALLFLLPTQFPGTAQTGLMGRFVKRINPIESVNQFLEKVLVNNRTPGEMAYYLWAPVIFGVIVLFLLLYAAPRLDFTGEKSKLKIGRSARTVMMIGLVLLLTQTAVSHAQTTSADPENGLKIIIDTNTVQARTGDTFDFTTTVQYDGQGESPAIVVAMNLVNLGSGDPVDPEDWSPERTQTIDPLSSGETAVLTWTINAILEGDYLAYMTVIPTPDSPQSSTMPLSSPGLHLTVERFTSLNPGGIAPVAFGMPVVLAILMAFLQWRRRRELTLSMA
jgi:ABC-2 type transport system permease protein